MRQGWLPFSSCYEIVPIILFANIIIASFSGGSYLDRITEGGNKHKNLLWRRRDIPKYSTLISNCVKVFEQKSTSNVSFSPEN